MNSRVKSKIELLNVSFAYNHGNLIIRNLSLNMVAGEFLGLVGPNGSGKTTLAKLLNGSLLPNSGSVIVNGLNTNQVANQPQIKRLVTLIHSDPENQLITPTVFDEITFSLRALNLDEHEILKRSEEALDTFHLQQYKDTHPYFLSVGEQFRLLLAAGLVRHPEFIVLDEVFSMLDSHSRYSVNKLLLELRSKYGVSIILLTHRLDDLLDADRIIVLVDGQLIAQGKVNSIFAHTNIFHDWRIETPLSYQILSNLPPDFRQIFNLFDS
jgi:energy-coupling factor transport system ATP-binding protein